MPWINLKMWPGRTDEAKRELAEKTRDFLAREMNIDRKYFAVTIEEILPERWDDELEKVPQEQRVVWPEE